MNVKGDFSLLIKSYFCSERKKTVALVTVFLYNICKLLCTKHALKLLINEMLRLSLCKRHCIFSKASSKFICHIICINVNFTV